MNMFTDLRYHVLEYVIAHTVIFIPMFMLGVSHPNIVLLAFVAKWYRRFYHANIRTNLGWLRYVLVTPQSHRVHHSTAVEHRDLNFGVTFSIWDQMFGTQYRGWDEYPETGVDDETFPYETTFATLPVQFLTQAAYPFYAIARNIRGWFKPSQG